MTAGGIPLWIYIGASLLRGAFALRKQGHGTAALAAFTSAGLVLPFALGVLPMIYVLVPLAATWLVDAAPAANHRPAAVR